jgi:hypothetical protein
MAQLISRWFGLPQNLGARYNPLYFLAALGNGGMAITFFLYLNFMIPHPTTPIITFDGIAQYLSNAALFQNVLVYAAMAGILFFGLRHLRLVAWNLRQYFSFRQTTAFHALRETNAEATLMSIPLTLAMSINVFFVGGAVFVPGLWNYVEYLFPIALTVFLAIGFLAMRIFTGFFTRILTTGDFDCTRNNNLSQLLSVFAMSMVAVGLAASAAMSQVVATITVAMISSIFFLTAAALIGLMLLTIGFRAMLAQGVNTEASVSLWTIIPILTLMSITVLRLNHGLEHAFGAHIEKGFIFVMLTAMVAIQTLFGIVGFAVMNRNGFFKNYVWGKARSVGSYALICPGVAFFVLGLFFVNVGLVQTGIVAKFSPVYFALLAPFVAAQIAGIAAMLRLDSKLLRPSAVAHEEAETEEREVAPAL